MPKIQGDIGAEKLVPHIKRVPPGVKPPNFQSDEKVFLALRKQIISGMGEDQIKPKTRKVDEITGTIPYGFYVPTPEGKLGINADPSNEDIALAVKNKEFENRGFQSHLKELQAEWEAGTPSHEEYGKRVKTYHARRIAYWVEYGWKGDPIELKPDGSMSDGLHRWRAAKFLRLETIEVKIVGEL